MIGPGCLALPMAFKEAGLLVKKKKKYFIN